MASLVLGTTSWGSLPSNNAAHCSKILPIMPPFKTSQVWSGLSPLLDSSDGLLVTRIDKQFEDLSLYEQGSVTYIKIALDEMFTISNTVVTTLQGFLENFAKDGC